MSPDFELFHHRAHPLDSLSSLRSPLTCLWELGKKITYGCRLRDKVGDHAGSLIASMAIDLATKSSPEFKYTHEGPSFWRHEYFRAMFARAAIDRTLYAVK